MAFTWNEAIIQGVTKIKGSLFTEMQSNIDTVHDNIECIDYVNCPTHCASFLSANDASILSGHCTAVYWGQHSGHRATDYNSYLPLN